MYREIAIDNCNSNLSDMCINVDNVEEKCVLKRNFSKHATFLRCNVSILG